MPVQHREYGRQALALQLLDAGRRIAAATSRPSATRGAHRGSSAARFSRSAAESGVCSAPAGRSPLRPESRTPSDRRATTRSRRSSSSAHRWASSGSPSARLSGSRRAPRCQGTGQPPASGHRETARGRVLCAPRSDRASARRSARSGPARRVAPWRTPLTDSRYASHAGRRCDLVAEARPTVQTDRAHIQHKLDRTTRLAVRGGRSLTSPARAIVRQSGVGPHSFVVQLSGKASGKSTRLVGR